MVDAKRWGSGSGSAAGQQNAKVEPSVRATLILVTDALPKDQVDMASAEHVHPVEAFGSDRPDPAFRERVGPRRSDGVFITRMPWDRNASSTLAVVAAPVRWTD